MKMVSSLLTPQKKTSLKTFFSSPYLSLRGLKCSTRPRLEILPRFLIYLALTVLSVYAAGFFPGELNNWKVMLISPLVLFITEAMGALGQLLFPLHNSCPIHRNPMASNALGNFWGMRWNRWVQDWLRDVSRSFKGTGRAKGIAVTFLISGLFHELMCNLPYWLVYRRSYFGTMMAYFIIQGLALWIEKKYIRVRSPFWKRIYCWCVVIIPSPLFINVPLLTFLGLKHV